MMYKTVLIICFTITYTLCFFPDIHSQKLFQEIDREFSSIDSSEYLKKSIINTCMYYMNTVGEDSLWYRKDKNKIKDWSVVYVLTLDIDSILNSENSIRVDASEYNFSLLFFDKSCNLQDYHISMYNSIPTNLVEFNGNVYHPLLYEGYKKVMMLKPKYILRCFNLPCAILYIAQVSDKKIFVYHVWSGKTYLLEDYMTIVSQTDNYQYTYFKSYIP